MNKLFILSGASGAGKSTLLDRLVKEGICNAAVKYSERKRFNTVDDVFTVENLNDSKLDCDIIYTMYGNRYGFSTKRLRSQLNEGNLILITNDKLAIKKIKEIFPQQVIVIYIVSDINKTLLRQIYMKRHGFPTIKSIEIPLLEQLKKAEKVVLQDDGESFIQCMETMNELIDNIVLGEEEFRLRLESIKHQEKLYSLDLFTYDYTVLNLYSSNMSTIHATKSAFEQLKRIIGKEMGEENE